MAFFVIFLPIFFTLIIFRSPAFVTALFVLGVLPALSEHTPSMHKTAPFSTPPIVFQILSHLLLIYPSPLSISHYSPYAVACVPHLSQNCYHRCQLPRWKQSHPLLTAKDGREIKETQRNKQKRELERREN